MIARVWHGWAPPATAMTISVTNLRMVGGFRGAGLPRRQDGQEVMFTSITFFVSLDAIGAMPETTTNWPSSRKLPGKCSAAGTSRSRITKSSPRWSDQPQPAATSSRHARGASRPDSDGRAVRRLRLQRRPAGILVAGGFPRLEAVSVRTEYRHRSRRTG
jgi:hypothetical protein